ncbi:MAG: hypothetical protein QUV07_05075 [Cyanobium sp. CZS 25K]|nr:hypothetical protein [Cyanobium sp. CZS25K]
MATLAIPGDVGIISRASPKATANGYGLLVIEIAIMVEAVPSKLAQLLALATQACLAGNALGYCNEVSYNLSVSHNHLLLDDAGEWLNLFSLP